ncbi:uncharacterized protein E6C27_scaffold428G00410 [Cucumis melo var. makuwa]|uniref:Asp_protease_2 domain-containing protein n=1 Tax=Cucumis melo var. makuwa TaxID=1194695 RepID=A0A5A7UIJ1_CUCMM|nr:uncharacterized protein E6C27_scaffold428G00410 [Cucumis melo var. makuwa]
MERGLLYVDTWINQKQTKSTMIDSGATHNFITEAEARRLRLRWEKDSGRMKAANSVALPIVRLVKRTTIKLRGWKGPVDFVVVKMDDFNVVLGMEFLLEHQVIPMPSAKCLVITGSFPIVVQADIRQPNGFKMISAMQLDKNPIQEEPPSVEIPLRALEKMEETVPKGTLCVPEKYHGVMPKSWPKSLSMRRMTDHGIELSLEAKAPAKNANRTMPPELAILRKQSKKLSGTGFSRSVQASWGAPVLSLKKKDRSLRRCIDFPHPIEVLLSKSGGGKGTRDNLCHRINEGILKKSRSLTELLEEEDIQWGGNLECQAAFDGLKQATIEGPSLRVANAIKPLKVEVEQFNCMFEEYMHYFVDGRQGNWAQLLNVAQFGHNTQTYSLIRRIQFEIKGNRHSVLSPLADGPYVKDDPQVHIVEEEWEQMADIARVCLEEASRPMEERVDQKRCPLEFEWMTKFLINGATTSYDYLST